MRDLEAIPPMPQVVVQLLAELSSDHASNASIARHLSKEPALAAAVLRMANSAAYSPANRITSVEHAVAYVGLTALRATLLADRLSPLIRQSQSDDAESCVSAAEEIWTHSLVVSQLSEHLAARFGAHRGLCSTLGLLHDLGKLVILHTRCDMLGELSRPGPGDESRLARERRLLGADHAELGAQLTGRWGLPSSLVNGIRFHHVPGQLPVATAGGPLVDGADANTLQRALATVFLANQLAKCLYSYADDTEIDVIPPSVMQVLGTDADPEMLIDDGVRRVTSDALLLAAASLSKPPGTTARLIRLTHPERRSTAIDLALLSLSTGAASASDGFSTASASGSAVLFDAAGGEAHLVRSRRREDDAAAVDSAVRFLGSLGADESLKWKFATALGWLVRSLRELAAGDEITLAVSRQDGRFVGCVACDALRFSRRFGEHVNPAVAAAAVRAECAGVLNLRWFRDVCPSADGVALRLVA